MQQQTASRDQYLNTVIQSGLLQEVPPNAYKDAFRQLGIIVKEYAEEEIIFSEEVEVKRLGVIHQGSVRGEKFHLEGDVHLMHMYRRGDIFGTEAATSRTKAAPLTYIANEKTLVLFASLSHMMQGPYSISFAIAVMHILADDNIRKLYKIETLAKRGLRDRIMTYLRIMEKKAGADTFAIYMDREQFSQYLCVNRSALSYELNEMKRDGLITFKKNTFKIIEKE